MQAVRRSSMIQEVPTEFSERVVVNHGTDGQPSRPSKTSSAVKDITIKSLVFASMFVVFLLKGNVSIFRFNIPSRESLLDEIDHLKYDLEAYEALKEQYVNEEMQLQWEKQHITASEEVVTSMLASSKDLSDRFHDVEQHMKEESDHMQSASESSTSAAEHDHETEMELSKDIQKTNAEARHEHEETVSLRRQISKMMEELRQKNIEIPEQIYDKLNPSKY